MRSKKIIVAAVLLLFALTAVLILSAPQQAGAATTIFGDQNQEGSGYSPQDTLRGSLFTCTSSGTANSITTYIYLNSKGTKTLGDTGTKSDWGALWDTIKGAQFTMPSGSTGCGGYAQNIMAYLQIWDTTSTGHLLGQSGSPSTYFSIVDNIRGSSFTCFHTGSIQNIKAYVDMGTGVTFFGQQSTSNYDSYKYTIVNNIRGSSFSAPDSGRIQSITANIAVDTSAKYMKAAIYYSNGVLLAQTNEVLVPIQTVTLTTFSFATPPLVTEGSIYVLVVWSASSTGNAYLYKYTFGTGYSPSYPYGSSFPNPASFGSSDSIQYTIYANYAHPGPGDSRTIKAAIYDAANHPVATTQESTVSSASWVTLTFASPPTVTQGASYVLVAWANDNSGPIRLGKYTTGSGRSQSLTYGSWPDPASFTTDSNQYSIYCTYANTGTARHVTAAIYTAAHALVATTNELTVSSTNWYTFTFSSPPLLTKGASYVLVVWGGHDSGPIDLGRSSGSASQGHYLSLAYGSSWPTTASFTEDSYTYGIYCNYIPSINFKAGIYSSTGSFVGGTEEKAVSTDGWTTFNFLGTKPSLTANTAYVLVAWSETSYSNPYVYATSYSSPDAGYTFSRTYGSWPATASFSYQGYYRYSIYCTVQTSYTITPSAGSGGSINPNTAQNVVPGGSQTFTFTPSNGYYVSNVLVDSLSVGAPSSYTFTSVAADHTISVSFATPTITFTTSGISGDTGSANIFTIDSTSYAASQLPKTFSWLVGSTHNVAALTVSSTVTGKQYRWNSWTNPDGLSGASGTYTTPGSDITVTANYVTQWQQTFQSSGLSADATGNLVSITTNGQPSSATLTVQSGTVYVDNGATVSYTLVNPVTSSIGGKQYRYSSVSGPASGYTVSSINTVTGTYVAQYQLTVASGHDSPSPAVGATWYDTGASVPASVTSPTDTSGGTRVRCTGWTGTGSVASSGSGTSTTFTITAASSITWNWQTQYYLTVTGGNNIAYGTASPTGDHWYDTGTSTTVSSDWVWNTAPSQSRTAITNYAIDGNNQDPTRLYSGTLTTSSVTMTNYHTVAFASATQYYLTVNSAHGTTSGAGWYDSGSTAYAGLNSGTVSGGPGTQYIFTSWADDASGPNYAQSNGITMSNYKTATAGWQTQYQVTFATGTGGSTNPSGTNVWEDSGSLPITATASQGYHFSSWSSTGPITFDNAGSASTTATIAGTGTITANFATNVYTIDPSAGSGGSISPNTPQNVNYGQNSPTFSISPSTGYHIADVVLDGTTHLGAANSYQFTSVTADHTIVASFAINTYDITPSAGAGGSISPNTVQHVNYGADSPTFSISPSTGHHTVDVILDGTTHLGAVTSYQFTNVQAGHTIVASFAINQYTITASAGSGGSISPSGSVSVNYGGDKDFTITLDPGYDVANVVVDGVSKGPVTSWTFTNVRENGHTIYASFELNVVSTTITVQCNPTTVNKAGTHTTTISGTLTAGGSGVQGKTITLYYNGGIDWIQISAPTITTGTGGSYTYDWVVPTSLENGYYAIRAAFIGDSSYDGSHAETGTGGEKNDYNLFVVPEYLLGGLLALLACFAAFVLFKKRSFPLKLVVHKQ